MEKVNHPVHYNISGRKECIEEMFEKYGMEITAIFCFTNAYKYLYRAGIKEGETQEDDISKAKWYYRWIMNKGFHIFEVHLFETMQLYQYVKKELERYGEE